MTSCILVRCGAVQWETSAPLLLQNPLITWFYLCGGFFISREEGGGGGGGCSQTHKLCPNDNRGNAITGNTFTTSPVLSPQWLCCMRTTIGRTSLFFPISLCSGGLCDCRTDVVSSLLGSVLRLSGGFVLSRINDWGDKGIMTASLGDAAELPEITSIIH